MFLKFPIGFIIETIENNKKYKKTKHLNDEILKNKDIGLV